MKEIVLYHKNCLDGFAAANIAYQAFGKNATYIAVNYNEELPEIEEDSNVYALDFSYPKDILITLAKKVEDIYILDHHKTAKEALETLDVENIHIVFDMEKSGCRLTWEFFNPYTSIDEIPRYIKYIEDRDLWKFQYRDTKAFCKALYETKEMSFDDWKLIHYDMEVSSLIAFGNTLLAIEEKELKFFEETAREIVLHGFPCLSCNVPLKYASELGNRLAKFGTFGLTYWFNGEKWLYSLRSIGDFDVSDIAKQYAGGGHKNAAGFSTKQLLEELENI